MKIKKIKISWFRGAADPVELDLSLKSIALYGENGSGKSSFIDAVEHNINSGRINHLAHEYSGKRQEKAVVNTHTPGSQNSEITIKLEDNSLIETKIFSNGTFTVNPTSSILTSWDYRCTILRQNEVADFIADTKGDKYSALLPLLGLSHLEIAAENLRKIERNLPIISSLQEKKREVERVNLKRKSVFGMAPSSDILIELKTFYSKYCGKPITDQTNFQLITETLDALNIKVSQFSSTQKIYSSFFELSRLDIEGNILAITESFLKLGESTEPLIAEKLAVLKSAISFSEKNTEEEVNCPACGKKVSSSSFSSHIKEEETLLKDAFTNFNVHKANINILCSNLETLKRILSQEQLKEWKSKQDTDMISGIESIDIDIFRNSYNTKTQEEIRKIVLPFIELAKLEVVNPLSDISDLLLDKTKVETINEIMKASSHSRSVKKIEETLGFIITLQKIYREQIRVQSAAIIGTISADVARMWGLLHPEERVEDVRLCLPEDVDKAIEIGLKFYGIEQDSPRLTLSEGHRNSLGLCIFLAMAKREDTPIFLDDVVVSFDRNHRGRVGTLLEQEFSDRQIILFTHERDWYIELKTQLDAKRWEYKSLMPWEGPDIGIRLAARQFGFDDARSQLLIAPDTAGNTARKIMDISLSFLAEDLGIRLPYLHREKNDHRVSHEFLAEIINASSSFEIKSDGTNYVSYTDAIEDFKTADKLLISWGNKSSHDFDIVKGEAAQLIDSCEKSLERFNCPNCKKRVTTLINPKTKVKLCECGFIRWK